MHIILCNLIIKYKNFFYNTFSFLWYGSIWIITWQLGLILFFISLSILWDNSWACSVVVLAFSILIAYNNKGISDVKMGSEALFSAILNIIGIAAGLTGLSERDIYKWVPIASAIINSVVLAAWITLIIWGNIVKWVQLLMKDMSFH